ncbi:MAG TPA: alpha/beta fold hydrolase [Thermoanaerobaculia bacterium]|nr:alpha/beta fold hydrolase [Thermoanaerobaculia bacterium]
MPYANQGGRRFYYEVGGEGETVLLLHGSYADADILEAPASAVSSGFRALCLDRRGHGRSSDAPEPLSLADEAKELASLLDWFSTETVHLLAHDDGAEVAIQLALDFPVRTLSLVLLAPTLEGFSWSASAAASRRDRFAACERNLANAIEEHVLASPAFAVAKETDGLFDRLATIYRRARLAGGSRERPPHSGPTQAARLGEIRARTAVLVGDREEPDRLRCAATIVQGIRGAEGMTFAGTSRFLHMEDSRHIMRRLTDFYIPPEE